MKHDEGELSEKYEEDGSQGHPLYLHWGFAELGMFVLELYKDF